MKMISAEVFTGELKSNENMVVVDVRSKGEFVARHIEKANCFPLMDLDEKMVMALISGKDENVPIYLLCQSGARAKKASEKLAEKFENRLYVVEGGMNACIQAGAPTIENKQSMDMFRQVQITAGSLISISMLTGTFVHPGFYGIAAFVGIGLIFSGVTNTCGMALLLAKLPWNKM